MTFGMVAGASLLALAACDNGPSAVARPEAAAPVADSPRPDRAAARDGVERADRRDDPVPLVDGKPMWSANRRYSAEENAQRAFDRNGEAFGAKDVDDFVGKAHAFVSHPPRGALTLTRANGDVMIYDPKENVFAVASKAGAPRTMFKPDNGKAYWDEQTAKEAKRQTARSDRDASGRDEG